MKNVMSHIVVGRIVGLFAGLMMFSDLIHALSLVVLGVVFDIFYARYIFPKRHQDVLFQRYSVAVVELCAKMCKSDGVVTREEIDAFRRRLIVDERDMPLVSAIFNRAKKATIGFEARATQIRELLVANPSQLVAIVEVLYEIALSDGYIAPGERAYILKVAEIFGLSGAQLREMEQRLTPGPRKTSEEGAAFHQQEDMQNPFQRSAITGKDPLKILGVKESATRDEIKHAYRKLVAQSHPDKLRGSGASAKEIERAETRMTELNAAYADLMKLGYVTHLVTPNDHIELRIGNRIILKPADSATGPWTFAPCGKN